MIQFLKDFFHLSNSELKGAFVLLFLIVMVFVLPRAYYRFQNVETIQDTEFETWVVEANRKEDSVIAYFKIHNINSQTKNGNDSLFTFNPNTVSYAEMKLLGFDGKTANILLKYRKKGAKFYKNKDLLKIYGFSEVLYDKIEEFIDLPNNSSKLKKETESEKEEVGIKRFDFNPNTVTYKELKQLGFDSKTANILLKFRGTRTVFYSKKDLMKVYGFTEELYNDLEEYIIFPKRESKVGVANDSLRKFEEIKYQNLKIELNTANEADLKKLKGIGPYIAKEIVKYRTILGGFYKVDQLIEVYGIKEELLVKIESKLNVNSESLRKINLNKTTFKELIRHPYISKEITIAILKLKKELGSFTKVEDLIYYDTINKEDFEKVKPYFVVN